MANRRFDDNPAATLPLTGAIVPGTQGGVDVKIDVQDIANLAGAGGASAPQFRLTLTSGIPVTPLDVTAATTIYYTPYGGNQVQLWDGSAWTTYTSAELTLALGTMTASIGYDVFLYINAGVPTLEKLAWTSATVRATAVTLQDGRYCKSGDKTRLYVGSFYASSTTTTEDSQANRLLWNYYNRMHRVSKVVESTDTWTYSTNSYRQVRATATNKLTSFVGMVEDVVQIEALGITVNSVAGFRAVSTGIGINSTTVNSATLKGPVQCSNAVVAFTWAHYGALPPLGYTEYVWLEKGSTGDTQTWNGDAGVPADYQAGIFGFIKA